MSKYDAQTSTPGDTIDVAVTGNGLGKRLGIIATCVVGGSLVALYAVTGPFVAPALRKICLPFVPATSVQVENVFKVLQQRTGSLVDIGSGDGRIVSTGCRVFSASCGNLIFITIICGLLAPKYQLSIMIRAVQILK